MVGGSLRLLWRSTTKAGRHDIAEILLKVALKDKKSKSKIKSIGLSLRQIGLEVEYMLNH